MKKELSVIVPCYNEETNIPELVKRLKATFIKKKINGEIILVNDHSTDATAEIIKKLAEKDNIIITIDHEINKGLFEGWKSGLKVAEGEYACFIDADLQNMPEDVGRLLRHIKHTNCDVVQGYRSSIGRLKDSRYIFSKGLNLLLNIFFGMRAKDNKSGFVIAQKDILEDSLRFKYRYYYPQTFIAVALHGRGYSIEEIETLFQSRLAGESFITKNPWRPIFLSFVDMFKAFFEFRIFVRKETIPSKFINQRNQTINNRAENIVWWRKLLFDLYFWTMPLHAWMITRNTKKYYYELKKSQWISSDEMRKLQENKLRRLIWQAYNHVGYYRQKFDELGLRPADIQTIEDLHKLPLLDKSIVRENLYFDLLSDNHDKRKILKVTTSGSSGEPFVCYVDRHQLEMRWAATLRSAEWTGYRFGDRQLRLWHQTLGMSYVQIVKEFLDAWLSRRKFVPAYKMTGENIIRFIDKLKRYKPILIDGYAESFNFLANYIKENGLKDIHFPKGIISSAQILPDQSREIIEKSFGCKVFDKYGSREFSGIAYESDGHEGHLVVAENYIVEIIKDGRPALPGEVGEVIITDLNNYCMPFIRYRVGDLAVAMDNSKLSPCGRGLPRIGRIEGRAQSIIVGTNGNHVPGTFFSHLFKDYDHIVKQYRVIQEKRGSLTLQIVKSLRFDEATFNEILKTHYNYLGKDMDIKVEFLDEIPMIRTGKQQGSISKLNIDFQELGNSLTRYKT